MPQRTFADVIEQVVNRNPKLKDQEYLVREALTTLAELVFEDAQFHTETPEMVICVLYDKGKDDYNESVNH